MENWGLRQLADVFVEMVERKIVALDFLLIYLLRWWRPRLWPLIDC